MYDRADDSKMDRSANKQCKTTAVTSCFGAQGRHFGFFYVGGCCGNPTSWEFQSTFLALNSDFWVREGTPHRLPQEVVAIANTFDI